jgi:hypothetical protein
VILHDQLPDDNAEKPMVEEFPVEIVKLRAPGTRVRSAALVA